MKKILLILLFFPFFLSSQNIKSSSYFDELTPEERRIMVKKGTERAGAGIYIDHFDKGVYICKACNNPLFRSEFKFKSDCGWPSIDDEIKGAILRYPDYSYGMKRVEICCANCKGHLGHVFEGEKITEKNIRHCVKSLSIKYVSNKE